MALMLGGGPFGQAPAGAFNLSLPREGVIYFEEFPRRMRGLFAGETVVDSTRVKLMHEYGQLGRCYFPFADVRMERLERNARVSYSPGKGAAVYWNLSVGGRVVENAAWSFSEPDGDIPGLAGYIAFYWNALDGWLEEDEEAVGHVRDPYHRMDVLETSRKVRVSLEGQTLAESDKLFVVHESSLPPRWYFPPDGVTAELTPSGLSGTCAYKGHGEFYSVRIGSDVYENIAWTYPNPRRDAARIKDHIAYFDERVDTEIDGEPQPRPPSPWSEPGWWLTLDEFEAGI